VFERERQRLSLPVSGNVSFNAGHAALEAAIAGVGITQTLSLMAYQPIVEGRLQPLLLGWSAPGPPILCIYAHRKHVPAKVRVFIEFATRLLSTSSRWPEIQGGASAAGSRTGSRTRAR
jgi:DNA-binding transcriptional LysR family regulator